MGGSERERQLEEKDEKNLKRNRDTHTERER